MKTKQRAAADRTRMVEAANRVLSLFRGEPGRLELREGFVYFATKYGAKACFIRGQNLGFRYGALGLSGTSAAALVQLVLWVRGQPRRPLVCWRHWCRHGLGGDNLIAALAAEGYADANATACVVCGKPDPTDWYDRGGLSGPCCQWAKCDDRLHEQQPTDGGFRT